MILLIDNYDSFTWNLADLIRRFTDVKVIRNDAITIREIESLSPSGIVISPGPGIPSDSGICPEVVQTFAGKIPILGVCLGHQLIAELYGAKISRANQPMHGKTSPLSHNGTGVFKGLPGMFDVMRYHSLVINDLPKDFPFVIHAQSTDTDEIMGIRHKELALEGVQFHPESILTLHGEEMIKNWLEGTSP